MQAPKCISMPLHGVILTKSDASVATTATADRDLTSNQP